MSFEYYTLDRIGSLKSGMVIDLEGQEALNPKMPQQLKNHAEELFPEGLSRFGSRYINREAPLVTSIEPSISDCFHLDHLQYDALIEVLFELVRKSDFPKAPSRLQSYYAVDNLEQSRSFRRTHGGNGDKISG